MCIKAEINNKISRRCHNFIKTYIYKTHGLKKIEGKLERIFSA